MEKKKIMECLKGGHSLTPVHPRNSMTEKQDVENLSQVSRTVSLWSYICPVYTGPAYTRVLTWINFQCECPQPGARQPLTSELCKSGFGTWYSYNSGVGEGGGGGGGGGVKVGLTF